MEKTKMASKSTIIIRTIFTTLFGIAAIFVPAGTLKWTEAWLFILQPSSLFLASSNSAIPGSASFQWNGYEPSPLPKK